MSFLGSVSRLGGQLVRPHDIVLERHPVAHDGPQVRATVLRVARLGFEVRVELEDDGGHELSAQLTRGDVDALALKPGDVVWARTARASALPVRPATPTEEARVVDTGQRVTAVA